MDLIYNNKVENIFSTFIEQTPIKKYLNELRTINFKLYLNSLKICFLAMDIGISNGFKKEDIETLGYAGLFYNIKNYGIYPQFFVRKNNKKKYNLYKNYVDLNNVNVNSKLIILDCFNSSPKKYFNSLKNFNCDETMKIILGYTEHYKSNSYPRNGTDRRDKQRLNLSDRRKSNKKVEKFSKIIAIVKLFYDKKKKSNTDLNLNTQRDIIFHIDSEFKFHNIYINDLIARI